jgi:hypothetical protein
VRKTIIIFACLILYTRLLTPVAHGEEDDTFSISLVQRATVKKMQGREIIYERYEVKKGDYIWKLLRQRGLLKKPDLSELLSLVKSMNPSLTNLDLIHPRQTILIPLNIIPVRGYREGKELDQEQMLDSTSLEDMDFEDYVVKPGDTLTMIVKNRFDISPEFFYDHYLNLIQKFNPTLANPDLIIPDQVIRLPIYSPEIVRMPIKAKDEGAALRKIQPIKTPDTAQTLALKRGFKDIFSQMGEEWVDTGEQYIPLKSGGQVTLKADSFPVLNLSSGRRLIVDIKSELPEDIAQLIEADWEDYRVIHLAKNDDLKQAMDKVLSACNFHRIVRAGDCFKMGGDIGLTIAGDWVLIPQKGQGDTPDRILTITLIGSRAEQTPKTVKAYLEKLGIIVIDYPDFIGSDAASEQAPVLKEMTIEKDADFPLPALLLNLAGQPFSTRVEMPLYGGEDPAFNVTIQADLFFNRDGKDSIIDTTGLSPHVVSLLTKHHIHVLSLSGLKEPLRMASLILDFLGLPFASKPHHFPAAAREETRDITLSFSGVSFADKAGKMILATDKRVPDELILFLNKSGYRVLDLTTFG